MNISKHFCMLSWRKELVSFLWLYVPWQLNNNYEIWLAVPASAIQQRRAWLWQWLFGHEAILPSSGTCLPEESCGGAIWDSAHILTHVPPTGHHTWSQRWAPECHPCHAAFLWANTGLANYSPKSWDNQSRSNFFLFFHPNLSIAIYFWIPV